MCGRCDDKMLALDNEVPHFIDWAQGQKGQHQVDPVKAREAFKQFQKFRKETHGL